MTCVDYLKIHWRALLIRWAVFSFVILTIAFFGQQDPRAAWPIAMVAGGLLNIAWVWVA